MVPCATVTPICSYHITLSHSPTPLSLQWLEEARISESHDPPMTETCRAIVAAVIGHGVEAEDREATWMGDAEECAKAGAIEAAR